MATEAIWVAKSAIYMALVGQITLTLHIARLIVANRGTCSCQPSQRWLDANRLHGDHTLYSRRPPLRSPGDKDDGDVTPTELPRAEAVPVAGVAAPTVWGVPGRLLAFGPRRFLKLALLAKLTAPSAVPVSRRSAKLCKRVSTSGCKSAADGLRLMCESSSAVETDVAAVETELRDNPDWESDPDDRRRDSSSAIWR